MYEPSRQLTSFHVAGFKYWDGALVLDQLKVGLRLSLVPEPDNPVDANAIAIYHAGTKLGYVPASENGQLAVLMFYGHGDVFECRVLQVAPEEDPWRQVRVGIYVRDGRGTVPGEEAGR